MLTILRGTGLFVALLGPVAAQMLPDSQAFIMNELEHIYFDNTGPAGFMSGITPCSNYIDLSTGLTNNALGRETAAQWIRVAFHDFVTADVAAGTGGLDASIGFESFRPENVGIAINDSLAFFTFFMNDKVSMADLIALGIAASVGTCGGAAIPFRGGRVDAVGPGPFGVPEPETDIKSTLADFSGAGFDQQDSIGLTACGHTMGGVHHSTFPQVVPESAVAAGNADGRIAFDDTVATFDVDVVQQYLDGRGNAGGPLVTTSNQTVRSDLRLYSSDGNATMRKLGRSADQFRATCTSLIARMIDTVPEGVQLTPVLDPRALKYANLTLSVDWAGRMTFSGFLRYIEVSASHGAPHSLLVTVIDRAGHFTSTSVNAVTDHTDNGNHIYGPTFHYPFSVSFPGSSGLSGIHVGAQRFQLQDSLFVVPTLSSISPGLAMYNILDPAHEFTFNVTAALRTSNPPPTLKGTIAVPVPQPGTISPKMDHSTTVQLSFIGMAGPFAIYSVVHQQSLTSLQLFGGSIDIVDEKGDEEAMFFKLFWLLQFF